MTKDVAGEKGSFSGKDYQDPPPEPLFDATELGKWSFYRALIAEFIATLLFLYVTVMTVIGYKNQTDPTLNPDQCAGVGVLGIAWAFGGMIFILVYCTAGISAIHDTLGERGKLRHVSHPEWIVSLTRFPNFRCRSLRVKSTRVIVTLRILSSSRRRVSVTSSAAQEKRLTSPSIGHLFWASLSVYSTPLFKSSIRLFVSIETDALSHYNYDASCHPQTFSHQISNQANFDYEIPMANSYTVLANLRAGRCSNKAEVRLLRFWDAKNIKGGKLISLEMLLIDEESTLVQGTVSAALSGIFRERLSEGSIYTLSGFDVTRSSPKYRLSDGPISIRFNEGTAFQKLATTTRVLPTEHFRFQPYDHILELANSGKQLPDVMGELRAIRSTITDGLPGPSRVMLTLCMEGDVNIVVSIFDSLAFAFHTKLDGYGREPRIVLVTAINPKIFSGKLYLNGTSATRVFFDSETAVGKIAFDRLTGGGTDDGGHSSKMVRAKKIEPISLAELNQFVITGDPQTIEFLCTAKITEVQLSEGWCYIGCATCSRKLIREESSFTCAPCNQTNAVAELKYRVVFSVSDDTDIAYFTGFDEEIAKLTHVLASEAAQIVGVGVNAEVDTELPRSLAPVVGNTYTFHLKLKDFNFTANHQTFTISRIYPAPELAPTPTFAEAEENVVPVAAGTGAVRDAAPVALTNTIAEQSSTSGGPLEGPQAADGEDAVLEESATKKARVE